VLSAVAELLVESPFGRLRGYAVHLRLLGKLLVYLLLEIIELFSISVTDETLGANVDWKPAFLNGVGQFGTEFQVEGDVPHQPFCVWAKIDASTFHMV